MTKELQDYIRQWLRVANEDAKVANVLFKSNQSFSGIVCYHCQQAIEKFLKAYLIYKGDELIKTHNLNRLLDEAKKHDTGFNNINLLDISQYAVRARYPNDAFHIPTISETETFLILIEEIKKLVEETVIL